MFGFDNHVEDILSTMVVPLEGQPTNPRFEEFKQFAVGYVADHSELEPNHQVLQQIQNSSSVDQIEAFLRELDYCDDCFLKMYRTFAIGEQPSCGCGGDDTQVIEVPEPEVAPGGG